MSEVNINWSLRLLTWIPEILERELFYMVAFSSALAVLNAVPCFMLDGQHIVKAFVVDFDIPCITRENSHLLRNRSKFGRWRKSIANTLTIFGTVLLILNVILGCFKAFGISS